MHAKAYTQQSFALLLPFLSEMRTTDVTWSDILEQA